MNRNQFLPLASVAIFLVMTNACSTPAGPKISLRAGTRIGGNPSLIQAQAFLARADYGLAIEEFRKVLRDEPESAAAIQGLAVSYDRLQRFDLSDRYFQQALALSPREPGIYRAYAASLRSQGRAEDAENLTTDMQAMLAIESSGPSDGPTAVASVAVAPQALSLPPIPSTSAEAPELASPTSYLERISLSEVRLVTHPNPVPSRTISIDISALMAAPHLPPRPTKILNAVGRPGIAGRFRGYLATKGWPHLEKGDAAFKLASSRIIFPPANRAEAQRLARSLPFPVTAVPMRKADRIIMLVGRDALAFDDANMAVRKS